MNIQKNRRFKKKSIILAFLVVSSILSCNTPKYTYIFEDGKYLDFKKGKWLLNNSISNSRVFDAELYIHSREEFKEILGSSLLEIVDVRQSKIITPEIPFDLNKRELVQLHLDSGCDFLINIKGNIISENAGSISFVSSNPDYYASNEASVAIKIYDLRDGEVLSSSIVYGKVIDRGTHFDNNNNFPILSTSSHNIMLKGAKRLIAKYKKNQL